MATVLPRPYSVAMATRICCPQEQRGVTATDDALQYKYWSTRSTCEVNKGTPLSNRQDNNMMPQLTTDTEYYTK